MYNEDSACAFFPVRSKSQRTVFSSSCHHFAPALLNTWFIQLLGCPPSTCSGASFIHLPELFLQIIFSATLFCWHTHPSPGTISASPSVHNSRWFSDFFFWGGVCVSGDTCKKFSKTEEGVNEQPTVTTGVICSIKEREDFYAVCASYTERYRHHGNKLVRQQQGTTLRLTITRDIISGGETSKALEFWFLLQPQSHLLLWTSFEFPVCKLKMG